jgi:ankyrin repeat protein
LVKSLLANRANVNRRNQHGDSALLLAALKPDLEAVKLLLEHGADVNPPGWAPLQYAMFSGSKEIAAALIAKGANVDARAPNGQTALMLAVKQGKIELVTLLVEARANKDLKDSEGVTALGHARKMDHSDTINYLQKVGAAG